jgi:hypothetical protein
MISDQLAPNLFPVVDKKLAPKDKKVIMLVTQAMQEKANNLNKTFKNYGISSVTVNINDPYNFFEIQEKLCDCLIQYKDKNIILNLTGGTKIMTIAAQSIFDMEKKPMFYVKERDNTALIMQGNKVIDNIDLDIKLKIKDYLFAYGYSISFHAANQYQYSEFTHELVSNISKYQSSIGRINSHVIKSNKKNALTFQRGQEDVYIAPFLDLCGKFGLLQADQDTFTFSDLQARQYVCGGWLEEYVYETVNQIGKQKIQDKALNMTIKSLQKSVENELDVAFLAKNCLHMIECKTGKLENEKGGDVLYKLYTLSDKLGLKAKSMLVSYRNIDNISKNERLYQHKKRADEYKIRVVQSEELINLKNHLEKWIAEN